MQRTVLKWYNTSLDIDLFSMSSYKATSRLVHNGGYIHKLSQLSKVLLNLGRFTVFWLQYSTSYFDNQPLLTSIYDVS